MHTWSNYTLKLTVFVSRVQKQKVIPNHFQQHACIKCTTMNKNTSHTCSQTSAFTFLQGFVHRKIWTANTLKLPVSKARAQEQKGIPHHFQQHTILKYINNQQKHKLACSQTISFVCVQAFSLYSVASQHTQTSKKASTLETRCHLSASNPGPGAGTGGSTEVPRETEQEEQHQDWYW